MPDTPQKVYIAVMGGTLRGAGPGIDLAMRVFDGDVRSPRSVLGEHAACVRQYFHDQTAGMLQLEFVYFDFVPVKPPFGLEPGAANARIAWGEAILDAHVRAHQPDVRTGRQWSMLTEFDNYLFLLHPSVDLGGLSSQSRTNVIPAYSCTIGFGEEWIDWWAIRQLAGAAGMAGAPMPTMTGICHELAHMLGMGHTWHWFDGAPLEAGSPNCLTSADTFMGTNPTFPTTTSAPRSIATVFTRGGPGLTGAAMHSFGKSDWFRADEVRHLRRSAAAVDTTVTLTCASGPRPVGRGAVLLVIDPDPPQEHDHDRLYVELRQRRGWDRALDTVAHAGGPTGTPSQNAALAAVVVHRQQAVIAKQRSADGPQLVVAPFYDGRIDAGAGGLDLTLPWPGGGITLSVVSPFEPSSSTVDVRLTHGMPRPRVLLDISTVRRSLTLASSEPRRSIFPPGMFNWNVWQIHEIVLVRATSQGLGQSDARWLPHDVQFTLWVNGKDTSRERLGTGFDPNLDDRRSDPEEGGQWLTHGVFVRNTPPAIAAQSVRVEVRASDDTGRVATEATTFDIGGTEEGWGEEWSTALHQWQARIPQLNPAHLGPLDPVALYAMLTKGLRRR